MQRRDFLARAGSAGMGVAAFSLAGNLFTACAPDRETKWNVVFILADDLGWNQVNYHGFGFYETPNIDRIAKEGMQFTDAYAAAPVCSPTRASLLTGKAPARLHITDYIPGSPYPYAQLKTPQWPQPALPLSELTVAELFQQNGYARGHFGKWHVNKDKNYRPGRPGDPESQGFDEVFTSVKPEPDDPPDDAHHAREITRRSIEFIEHNREKPFFCYVSHHVVHRPLIERDELVEKYRKKPDSDQPTHNPIMGAMIETMDRGIGEILDTLDRLDLSRKTIVVFYSDNGGLESLQSQAPLRGGKAMLYEGGLKVPLAVRWPGIVEAGARCETPVSSYDFFPTFAALIEPGRSLSPEIDGESLIPLFHQTGSLPREALYWHYPNYHHQGYKPGAAIRKSNYKLIEWFEESLTGGESPVELFDIEKDPGETENLASRMPALADQLLQELRQWRQTVGAQEMTVNPDFDPARETWRFADRETE